MSPAMTMATRRPQSHVHVFSTPQSEVPTSHNRNARGRPADSVHISTLTRDTLTNSSIRTTHSGRRGYHSPSHHQQQYHNNNNNNNNNNNHLQSPYHSHQHHHSQGVEVQSHAKYHPPPRNSRRGLHESSNVVVGPPPPPMPRMEWTTAGPAPIPVISKTVVAPPPPSTALFSNLSRQQLEGLKPDGIWRGFGEGYNVKDWGTFSKQAQLEDKNKKLQSSLRSASQSSASSSTSGGVIGTSSSSSNSSNMSYSNASTQGKLEVKPFIPSTRGSAVYELRPVTTTEPQPPPPPPPSHPSAPEDIIEERLLDLSDPIEPDKEVAETPSKINGALSDLIDLEFPTSPPLVEILLDLRFDSGDTGVRGSGGDIPGVDVPEENRDSNNNNNNNNNNNSNNNNSNSNNNNSNSNSNSNSSNNSSNNSNNNNNNSSNNNYDDDSSSINASFDVFHSANGSSSSSQIFMSAHSVLSTPVSTHNSLHFDQDEDGENDDDDDDDDDNDDDDDDDDGDDNDDDDDDEDDDYDEDEDDEDDALGGMWKQFDQGVVTLTLSTLNKIKMDLESENISWSDLRMQRL